MTYHPLTNSILSCSLDLINQTLEEEEIIHVIEPVDSDPNSYLCAAYNNERIHAGFVGYENGNLIFMALTDENDDNFSESGYDAGDLDTFLDHLRGEIRLILQESS